MAKRRVIQPRYKKQEFSKAHVVFADALVAFVYITNMLLAFLDKMPISDLAVAIITIYGGFATGGYFTLCAVRDTSLNKHRLRINEDSEGVEYKEEITDYEYDEGGSVG